MEVFKFQSEELLRQAIVKLLMRMPGVRDVQLSHGAQEYGKDIIFWSNGPLGEPVPCACVVKNTRIGGAVDKSSGARSILFQIEQALDTPFTDPQGQEQKAQRVYVISPESISQTAMNSIKGSLATRTRGVVFVPGEKLFELIRAYWTDFFVDEFAALEQHLQSLSSSSITGELQEVAGIYGIPAPEEAEEMVYVTRRLRRRMLIILDNRNLHNPIPAPELLAGPWLDAELQDRIAFLEALAKNINHLKLWSFLSGRPMNYRPAAEYDAKTVKVRLEVAKFASDLRSSLIVAQGRQQVTAGEDSRENKRPKYTLEFSSEAVKRAAQLRPFLLRLLAPLRDACRRAKKRASHKKGIDALQTEDARFHASLTDCLTSAPARLLRASDYISYTVTENDLRESNTSWFLVGPPGHGKTAFCRWNALLDAQHYRMGNSTILPVYVPLNILARRDLKDYRDGFLRTAGRSILFPEEESGTGLPNGARIRLYLDGLDEVPTSSKRHQIGRLALDAHKSGIQVFLTARDYISMPEFSWLVRLELRSLNQSEQRELFSRVLNSELLLKEFEDQLTSSGSMGDLLGVPLLARLVLLVFRQTGELPENRCRLYANFVDLLSGGWDLAKGLLRHSRFGRVVKRIALCRLAGSAHEQRRRYFRAATVTEALSATAGAMSSKEISSLFLELLRDGLLARSADAFYFSHLSFQEFLCALYYFGSQDRYKIETALKEFLEGDDWWREVIKFYIGLSENPEELANWLAAKLDQWGYSGRSSDVWDAFSSSFPLYKKGD